MRSGNAMTRPVKIRTMDDGPSSVESEQALLGCLLIDPATWPLVTAETSSADFARPDHGLIYEAIGELAARGAGIDVVTVGFQLQAQGKLDDAGGLAYLGTLAHDTATTANVVAYAKIIRGRAALRRLQQTAARLMRAAGDPGATAAELVADVIDRLTALQGAARTGRGLVPSGQLAGELLDDLDRRREAPRGLALGLADFDELTCGLEPGDLVVLAGRPSMGKTAWLVSVAVNVALTSPVAIFSAEMPAQQLMRRAVSLIGGISQGVLRRPERLTEIDWATISPAASQIARRHLWIDDTSLPALAHIRAECSALKARHGLKLAIVDYVQLVQGSGANRYEQLRDVAYGFKALAKDLQIPVIVLAQLNRGVESRDRKRPNLSDLRDSGAIEEAADIVGLLFSEGYYDRDFEMPYVLECQVAKNRNGERGECLWRFDGAHSKVTVLEHGMQSHYRQMRAKAQRGGNHDL